MNFSYIFDNLGYCAQRWGFAARFMSYDSFLRVWILIP